MESRMKMQKLERDMPKYLRAQRAYVESFDRLSKQVTGDEANALGMSTDEFLGQDGEEECAYTPEYVEDLMRNTLDLKNERLIDKYEPVLYQIIKDPKELKARESDAQTQKRFLDKTERIL